MLDEFLREHPEIEVQPFVMPALEGSAVDSSTLMAIAAGIPPHAIQVNFRQSSTYLAHGFLVPLEDLLARVLSDDAAVREVDDRGDWLADPTSEELQQAVELIRERVPEPAWQVVYREDESRRGTAKHVWALPLDSVVMALLYRKDLFFEAGLDPESPPQTWEELLEISRRLTIPEKQQTGMVFLAGQNVSWAIYTFLISNGARAVEHTEDGRWVATYDSREAAEAVAFAWRLIREPFERDGRIIPGAARLASSEVRLLWDRGQVGMQLSYITDQLLADINPQLVGIAPVPRSPHNRRGSEVNARMLGVFAGSTPQQQLAVMKYIWFITSDQAKRITTESFVASGYGPYVSPMLLEKFGYERVLRQVPPSWKRVFEEAMKAGVPEPYGQNTQNIYRYLSEPINSALSLDLAGVAEEERIDIIQSLLQQSARKVNEDVLSNVAPDTMRWRRIVGSAVLVLVAAAFVCGFLHIWRYFSRLEASGGDDRPFRRYALGYVLLIPVLVLTVLWDYMPLALGAAMSFLDYRLVIESTFVGVDNFAMVLFDSRFWLGFLRTLYFVVLMIGIGFWPPILLAILLDEVPTATLKYVFRTIFYLPAVLVGIVVIFLWKELYDPSAAGALNQVYLSLNKLGPFAATLVKWCALAMWVSLIGLLVILPLRLDELSLPLRAGLMAVAATLLLLTVLPVIQAPSVVTQLVGPFSLEPVGWIEDPQLAMLCVVIPTVWAASGPGCLLYLAALKTVPQDLYEAAEIDGAGIWHKVLYITLPRLKFLIGIQLIAAVIAAFKGGTEYILALTGGGPNNATMILALEIFARTFLNLDFGAGAAMAWILAAVLIGFTAIQLKMLARAEFTASGGGRR